MKRAIGTWAALLLPSIGIGGVAIADPWKDESGKSREGGGYVRLDDGYGRDYRREGKVKYRAGGCEIERKFKRGEYEEKIKCKPGREARDGYPAYGYYRY